MASDWDKILEQGQEGQRLNEPAKPEKLKLKNRTFYCDDELYQQLRLKTVQEGITISDVVVPAIKAYLNKKD